MFVTNEQVERACEAHYNALPAAWGQVGFNEWAAFNQSEREAFRKAMHAALTTALASMWRPTVDELAQIIREVDGNHQLGAGRLAEAILARLSTAPPVQQKEGV